MYFDIYIHLGLSADSFMNAVQRFFHISAIYEHFSSVTSTLLSITLLCILFLSAYTLLYIILGFK